MMVGVECRAASWPNRHRQAWASCIPRPRGMLGGDVGRSPIRQHLDDG